MLKFCLPFLIVFVSLTNVHAQLGEGVTEDIKMLIFTSIEYDGGGATKGTFGGWIEVAINHFEHLQVMSSPTIVFYKTGMLDSIKGEYKLQLFKILTANSKKQSRYLLWYKDFSSEVWLRVAGYVENDIHLLLNYLKEEKINKRKLSRMLLEWQAADPLFAELNWECMFAGYKKNSTKSDCFWSARYVLINNVSFGFDPLKEDQLNSVFSRMPLYGRFERY